MEEVKLTGIPETIAQAMETLTEFYSESLPEILQMSKREFVVSAHFGAGIYIRNSWYLNWYEGPTFDSWPVDKPALVRYFNDMGIVVPDYISSIIMNCFLLESS